MSQTNITVIFTCFNRREKTIHCMKTITEYNPSIHFSFIIVDDASRDGTVDAIQALGMDAVILHGNGNLFWCGGMRKGIEEYFRREPKDEELCLLINDDVSFAPNSIEKMVERLGERRDTIVVGATCGEDGKFSYGLRGKEKWYKKNVTTDIYPTEEEIVGDTGNANCMLIPAGAMKDVGNMDTAYTHSLGDYDLGFQLTKRGYTLISSADYIGVCSNNPIAGTWRDTSLPRMERIRRKESPKGSPFGEWWHFLQKNFGLVSALQYSFIPYVKILLKK